MRRLLVLAALAVGGWWLVRRRRRPEPKAVIGYADGSTIELEAGSAELERMVATARSALNT
jgi:hypothetical protein